MFNLFGSRRTLAKPNFKLPNQRLAAGSSEGMQADFPAWKRKFLSLVENVEHIHHGLESASDPAQLSNLQGQQRMLVQELKESLDSMPMVRNQNFEPAETGYPPV